MIYCRKKFLPFFIFLILHISLSYSSKNKRMCSLCNTNQKDMYIHNKYECKFNPYREKLFISGYCHFCRMYNLFLYDHEKHRCNSNSCITENKYPSQNKPIPTRRKPFTRKKKINKIKEPLSLKKNNAILLSITKQYKRKKIKEKLIISVSKTIPKTPIKKHIFKSDLLFTNMTKSNSNSLFIITDYFKKEKLINYDSKSMEFLPYGEEYMFLNMLPEQNYPNSI